MYLELQKRLGDRLREVLQAKYNLQPEAIPLEIPPDLQFGELATPIAFELARKDDMQGIFHLIRVGYAGAFQLSYQYGRYGTQDWLFG